MMKCSQRREVRQRERTLWDPRESEARALGESKRRQGETLRFFV